jgi:hypothetical protein
MSPMKGTKGTNMQFRIFALFFLFLVLLGLAHADDRLYLHLQCSPGQNCIDLAHAADGRAESVMKAPALVLAKADVTSASVQMGPNTPQLLSIELSKEASQKFEKITGENIGKKLAVVFDNKILTAPVINEAIKGRKVVISGGNGEQGRFWERAPWLQELIKDSYQESRHSVMIYVIIALAVSLAAFLFILLPRMRHTSR